MGIYAIKPRFRNSLRGIATKLAQRGISPDAVTTAGLAASAVALACYFATRASDWFLLLVPFLAFVRTAANALDGLVAEISGSARPAGALYNETADRIGDAAFIGGLGLVPDVELGLAFGALGAAALASFVGVAAKASGGTRRYDGPMGKPDRMVVVGVVAVFAVFLPTAGVIEIALGLIALGALVTALNRYLKAHKELDDAR